MTEEFKQENTAAPDTLAKELMEIQRRFIGDIHTTNQQWTSLEMRALQALNRWPEHPAFLFMLGTLYMLRDKSGLAIALLYQCMERGAVGTSPWLNLGHAYKVEHKDEKASQCYMKALAEANKSNDPVEKAKETGHVYHGLCSLYVNAGMPDLVMHWGKKALAITPNDRFALWNMGLAHLEKGEFKEGFGLYDSAGFINDGQKPMERKLKTYGGLPKWNREPGKTVICYGEQGVGDEIMFASMLPDLFKETKVILDIDKRIEKILQRSFPEAVAIYPTSSVDDPFPWIKDHKDADLCYFPMGSLGHLYRSKKEDFPKVPYFEADPVLREKWRDILAPHKGLKVGISYAGGLKKTRFDMRSIPLTQFKDILKTDEVQWFSLQYHPWSADEASAVGQETDIPVHHWTDMVGSYDETAAFLKELDLVITVNTSLHHLAGALGVKQWCLCPVKIAWRYGISGPSPWYGNCTMYRQKKDNDWSHVLQKVKTDLVGLVNA